MLKSIIKKLRDRYQTLLIFTLVGLMLGFIAGNFIFPKFAVEDELLVVPGSVKSDYWQSNDFIRNWRRIILSPHFLRETNELGKKSSLPLKVRKEDLEIKHFAETDIIRLRVKADSPLIARARADLLRHSISQNLGHYYPQGEKLKIISLRKNRLINYTAEIFLTSFSTALLFFVLGWYLIWQRDFDLKLFPPRQKNYQNIVKEKIRRELTPLQTKNIEKNSAIREEIKNNLKKERQFNQFNQSNASPTAKIIAASRPVAAEEYPSEKSKPDEILQSEPESVKPARAKGDVPENLPIFVDQEMENDYLQRESAKKSTEKRKAETTKSKQSRRQVKDKIAELIKQEIADNKFYLEQKEKETSSSLSAKEKQSRKFVPEKSEKEEQANDEQVAQKFAIAPASSEEKTENDKEEKTSVAAETEKIKERLNKLLQGEL